MPINELKGGEKMISVKCLDDGNVYWFSARTAYEAMTNMKYTLNLNHSDKNAIINKTESGLHLWMEHCGNTYATRM